MLGSISDLLSRSNSPDSAGPAQKLVLCVQLLSCVYISSVPVQQCVHLLSTALQQLCVHYLPNTVALKDSASWKSVSLQTLKVGANDRSAQELQIDL